MKLIIDIDDNVYKDIQSKDWKNGKLIYSDEWKAIHNGIPLDKIRERIKLEMLGYPPSAGYYRAIIKCLQIIDKYKA